MSDDPAPGAPSGVRFASFPGYLPTGSGPQLDSAGHTIFTAFLTTPDVLNDSGIWSDASGSLNQFAKSGAHPPDLPDGIRFWNVIDYVFTSYILTSDGHTGIFSSITGAGVTSATNYGLWLGGSNSLGLIMREGDHAPGTPAGVRFNQEG
ncbi:MAG TPA: choice-of-anchor tandem repeat NxxGxxAF-containing protein, partial [Lacipirellulaceae bacterium]